MLQWILGKSLKLDYAISDKRETSISDSTNYGYTLSANRQVEAAEYSRISGTIMSIVELLRMSDMI